MSKGEILDNALEIDDHISFSLFLGDCLMVFCLTVNTPLGSAWFFYSQLYGMLILLVYNFNILGIPGDFNVITE